MLEGVLIAESLQTGTVLAGVELRVTRIARVEVTSAAPGQPGEWTLVDFAADEGVADRLAEQLAECLSPSGGWYVNYTTGAEAFVVFPGKVFRYPRGEGAGRRRAVEHARSLGIPEVQLDWEE